MYKTPTLLLLLSMSACDAMHDSFARANDGLYEGGAKSRRKVAGWIYSDNGQPVIQAPDPERYCYNLRSDILCYDHPRAGMETTIVGAQQAQGYGNLQPAIPRSRSDGLQTNPIDDYDPSPRDYRNPADIGATVGSDSGATFVPAAPVVASDGSTTMDGITASTGGYDGTAPRTLIDR